MTTAGLAQTAAAFAILLSVIVRWIRSGASWQAVEDGVATAETLRDLTGITDYDKLQETFGPPRLQDGVFPVTRREVLRNRTGLGYLLGDRVLDGGSAIVAILTLMPIWPVWGTRAWLEIFLTFAAIYQAGGWTAAATMLGRRR
ncbi:MAG: hypothetical protein R3C52_11315 [Hyphomonadaceae bacterium]